MFQLLYNMSGIICVSYRKHRTVVSVVTCPVTGWPGVHVAKGLEAGLNASQGVTVRRPHFWLTSVIVSEPCSYVLPHI